MALAAALAGSAPATAQLVHQWTFNTDANDAVGGAHAALMNGAALAGGAVVLDGNDDHVSLPIGATVSGLTSSTFLGWVTWDSFQAPWPRIFDFGTGQTVNMFLTPRNGRLDTGPAVDTTRFAITTGGISGEQQLNSPSMFPVGTLTCVAVVIDAAMQTGQLYVGGALEASGPMTLTPSSLGPTSNNWLGRSQYADPFFQGSIDEFRIYNAALMGAQVQSVCSAGPEPEEVPTAPLLALALLALLLAAGGTGLARRRAAG